MYNENRRVIIMRRFSLFLIYFYSYLLKLFKRVCPVSVKYFSLVANPPRICLSDLFISKTFFASLASLGFIFFSLSVTSLWTVLFEIPNFLAVSLTVALLLMMKFATSTALSSMYVFKKSPPYNRSTRNIYV